jgi:hypothetical protein
MTKKLEKLARGQDCYMRLPGVCNGNPETTVLCHIRRGNLGGTGLKPLSLFALPMCSDCHDTYDARRRAKYSRTELDAEALRALGQWLDWLWKNEVVIVVAA